MGKALFKKMRGYLFALRMKLRYERVYEDGDSRPLKYLLIDDSISEPTYLIVVFSSCTRKGVPARYNYVKTLSSIRCPKLFILDEYGPGHRGCYYLGENGKFDICISTRRLIDSVTVQVGARKRLYCGSSKGGWAALYFGVDDPCGIVVAGAPQYRLGDYLLREHESPDGNRDLLPFICGQNEEMRGFLNQLVSGKIDSRASTQPVYLCFSPYEHTYGEHIRGLCQDLRDAGRELRIKKCDFTNHGEIGFYFAPYLRSVAEGLVSNPG